MRAVLVVHTVTLFVLLDFAPQEVQGFTQMRSSVSEWVRPLVYQLTHCEISSACGGHLVDWRDSGSRLLTTKTPARARGKRELDHFVVPEPEIVDTELSKIVQEPRYRK